MNDCLHLYPNDREKKQNKEQRTRGKGQKTRDKWESGKSQRAKDKLLGTKGMVRRVW